MDEKILQIIVKAKDEASKTLEKIDGTIKESTTRWEKMGQAVSNAGKIITGVSVAMAGALASTIPAWEETRKAQIAFENTVKHMPQLADLNTQAWYRWVSAMEMKLAVDDAEINKMASMLGTYGMTEKQMKQLIPVIVDLSRKYGIDLATATRYVGYAVQGNTAMLKRYGINLDLTAAKTKEGIDTNKAYGLVLEQLTQAVGGYSEALDKEGMMATERFKIAMGNLRETIGQVVFQAITPFLEKFNQLIIKFNTSMGPIAQWVAKIGMAATVLGLLAGPLMMAIGNIGKLASMLSGLMNPYTLIIEAIVSLTVYLYKNNEAFREFVNTVMGRVMDAINYVSENFGVIAQVITDTLSAIMSAVMTILDPAIKLAEAVFQQIVDWTVANWPLIQQTVETVMNAIQTVIDAVMGVIETLWTQYGENIKAVWGAVWDTVKVVVETAVNVVLNLLKGFMQLITGDWQGLGETLKAIWTALWQAILRIGSNLWTAISNTATVIWGGMKATAQAIWGGIYKAIVGFLDKTQAIWKPALKILQAVWETVWGALKPFIEPIIEAIKKVISAFLKVIKGDWTGAWNDIKSAVETIMNGIKDAITNIGVEVVNAAKGILNSITEAVNGIIDTATQWGKDLWNNFIAGVNAMVEAVKKAIAGVINAVASAFKNLVSKAWDWGKNLLKNFIDGMKSKLKDLIDTAAETGKAVGSYLGIHSPAEKGPLSDADKWMPNLITMMATQLKTETDRKLKPVVEKVAQTLKIQAPAPAVALLSPTAPISPAVAGITTVSPTISTNTTLETSPADLHNILYRAVKTAMQDSNIASTTPTSAVVSLEIDGQTFARLIYDYLQLEAQRRGDVEVVPV